MRVGAMSVVYYESMKRNLLKPIYECRCNGRLQTKRFTLLAHTGLLLFIIRVKRELKRVYRNGCRYNERLNAETGGSKTPRTRFPGNCGNHTIFFFHFCRKKKKSKKKTKNRKNLELLPYQESDQLCF